MSEFDKIGRSLAPKIRGLTRFLIGVTERRGPVQLIQYVSQISVLLMKLPRKDTSKPKQPLGFASGVDGDGNVK